MIFISTKGKRAFRPRIHFTAPKNWLNDPNGLVYENGRYHLFYQHNPEAPVHGPMYWGHAISKDLVNWEHLPIALEPDEWGTCFSGSAVYDAQNTSGLGSLEQPPIVLLYTSHGDRERQSVAYSTDGIHFTTYAGNPVIDNPGIPDFRDPKVLWNPIKSCWTLVLAAGDRVCFYASPDLLHWEKTGEFTGTESHLPGVWECPDLIPMKTDRGEEKWMLLVSMGLSRELGGSLTQYYIGGFDGDSFFCDQPTPAPLFLDDGFDNYAGVTFHNTPEPILISWGLNWQYANQAPTGEYCGMMTLARKLRLLHTPKAGLRLSSCPLGIDEITCPPLSLSQGGPLPEGDLFRMTVTGEGPFTLALENPQGQKLEFGVDSENRIFVDRRQGGESGFSEVFASPAYSLRQLPRYFDGLSTLDLIFDMCSFELYGDQGTRCISLAVFPDTPYSQLSVTGTVQVTVSRLQP